jgi:pantothenate kinase
MMSRYKSLYELNEAKEANFVELKYPHLSVNVGSGVSILLVKSADDIKRVSGTMMGGGTLIGLAKLLINVDNYNDIMNLAKEGDNFNLDLLVKDFSSNSKSNIGLDSDVIASSFGKINQYIQTGQKDKIKKEDIAKSLLVMVCFHIGQLAHLVALENNINKYDFKYYT